MDWSLVNFVLLVGVLVYLYYKRTGDINKILSDIKDTEETAKLINNSLVEGLIIADTHGYIMDCNTTAEKIFQYPHNSMQGMPVANLIPYQYKLIYQEGLARIPMGDEPKMLGKTVDLTGLRRDGSIIPLALSLVKVRVHNGFQYIAVVRDISERTHIIEQVKQLNSALETRLLAAEAFNRSVSHDLNAPLRSIDGFSEILEQDYAQELDGKAKDYIHRMRNAVIKMKQLIKDMMKLSIVTQPDTQLDIVSFSLTNCFKALYTEMIMSDSHRNVDVQIQENMQVDVDAELFSLALSNLFSNAWKFTSRNPKAKIVIGCNTVNNEKVYYISDNGVGFDKNKAQKLFEPFVRLRADFEGSGVGLTIVKRVIELHKGKVWFDAQEGKGATFYFTIGTKIYGK